MKTLLTGLTVSAIALSGLASAQTTEQRLASLEKELASLKSTNAAKNNFSGSQDLLSWAAKTSIGGYGELTYTINRDGGDEIDFQRFVLFLNHEFSDKVRFVSELEVEHANTAPNREGRNGAVELEQAYIEMDVLENAQFRAGLMLVPVGLLNETHEPPTFFGVERTRTESRIIPTTWRQAGIGFSQKFDNGFSYDTLLAAGLDVPANGTIRSGRGGASRQSAENTAFTARVAYTGIQGLRLTAFAQYNSDISQSSAGSDSALLYGATAQYQKGGFAIRALYSAWDIDGGVPADAESQDGWYVEPSYTWNLKGSSKIGAFARYEEVDSFSGSTREEEITTVGVNYWPLDNVVFKADYQFVETNRSTSTQEVVNLGMGFQF